MSKSRPPRPSQQELDLQRQQQQAIASQTSILEQQARRQEEQYQQQQQLAPLLYEQMGLRPQYTDGRITGYERVETPEQALYKQQIEAQLRSQPGQEALQQQYLTLAQQQAEYQQRQQPMQEQLQQQYLTLAQQQAEYAQRQQPIQERLQQQYLTIAEQQAAYQAEQARWQQELAPQMRLQAEAQTRLQQQMTDYQAMALQQYEDEQRLKPLMYEASGVRPIYDEAGNITSFGLTEEAQARKDYENQLLEHQRKALAGELPVDPTLERTLAEGETQLRAQLQAQLGTGYETSTPGIQALAEFDRRAAEARSNVAHGQLTSGQQLLASQAEMNARTQNQAYGGRGMLGEYGLRPVSFGQGVQAGGQPNYLGLAQGAAPGMSQVSMPGLFAGGSPAQTAAGYQAAVGSPYGTLGQFGDLAKNFGGLVQSGGNLVTQMANQRIGDYNAYQQAAGQYAGQLGQIGTAAGAVIGGAAGAFVGAPQLGAAAGGALGGMAGQYYGRATY